MVTVLGAHSLSQRPSGQPRQEVGGAGIPAAHKGPHSAACFLCICQKSQVTGNITGVWGAQGHRHPKGNKNQEEPEREAQATLVLTPRRCWCGPAGCWVCGETSVASSQLRGQHLAPALWPSETCWHRATDKGGFLLAETWRPQLSAEAAGRWFTTLMDQGGTEEEMQVPGGTPCHRREHH